MPRFALAGKPLVAIGAGSDYIWAMPKCKTCNDTCRMKLEGIVSKRRSSPYRSGECRDWRKIKTAA